MSTTDSPDGDPKVRFDDQGTDAIATAIADAVVGVDGTTTKKPPRIAHMPALDGMRGFYVITGPLLYHFAPYLVPGGIIGIDLFFVLSSFLIVTIALNEWDSTGRIDMKSYGSRRVRRLMPALLVTFIATAFATAFLIDVSNIPKWTGSIAGGMSWMANWREIFTGADYFEAGQYTNPAPFRHVWSFAIEEQFYLFAPFFIIICMKWLGKRWLAILSIGGAIASAIWMSIVFDPNNLQTTSRAYYGTDTRAFALLLGIAMAVVCSWWGFPRTNWGRFLTQFLGLISTAGFIYLMFNISEKTAWMFEYGGFFLVAVMSVFMTRAVSTPTGWLHWFYRNRFLQWAGRMGFGLYLYHWLVFILIDSNRDADQPGLNSVRDMVLGFGLTFLISWLSYKYIERPFVKGLWRGWKFAFVMACGFGVALALLLFANTVRHTAADGGQRFNDAGAVNMGKGSICTAPEGSDPVRVLVVGDSVMTQLGEGLMDWCADHPGEILVMNDAYLGCGITRDGEYLYEAGTGPIPEHCTKWAEPVDPALLYDEVMGPVSWTTAVESFQPDVVFAYASSWDTIDHRIPEGGDTWRRPGDPLFDAYLSEQFAEAISIFTSNGATLAWMTTPYINHDSPYNTHDRTDAINAVARAIVDLQQNHVIIDYPSFLGPPGSEHDVLIRDDGVHIRGSQLSTVVDWLAPQLVAAGHDNPKWRLAHTTATN